MTKIEEILIDFQAMGITASAMEIALGLEIGSIETASVTDNPEMIILLKIVKVYPWLLEVAEHEYDENMSQRIMLHNAVDIMMNERHNKKVKEELK